MEKKKQLARAELEVMRVLWEKGKGTVREVQETLSPRKSWGYTTVMTLLARMYGKGFLSREKVGLGYVYRPKANQQEVMRGMAKSFIDRIFNGALGPLVTYVAESQKLTPKEMSLLKKLAEKLGEKEKKP